MTSKTYHHGDLKSSLIASANTILREKGADALSLRAIAADVGVSHMAPYSHFKNKKELFQSIAAAGFDELADRMVKASEGLSKARELILIYGTTYVEFAIEKPQLYRLMLGQVEMAGRRKKPEEQNEISVSIAAPVVSSELEATSKRPFKLLRDAFALVNDDETQVIAQALGAWSMVHGMAALIIEGHFSIPETMTVKDFLAMAALQNRR